MQWNANGVGGKKMELKEFLLRRGVHVALIQESKLRHSTPSPRFPGYTTVRVDRPSDDGGGGLLALISQRIPFTHTTARTLATFPPDATRELQTLTLRVAGRELPVANLYLPPTSSCPPRYSPDLSPVSSPTSTSLLVGDFNAHDPSWLHSQSGDPRGSQVLQDLEELVILNSPDCPTRLPFRGDQLPTSPDVTLASGDLALRSRWEVAHDLSSDHLPILLDLQFSSPPLRPTSPRTFLNFGKADWPAFSAMVEEDLARFDPLQFPSLDAAAAELVRAIAAAGARHVPAGFVRGYSPTYSREVRALLQQRRHLRSLPPSPASSERIRALSEEISTQLQDRATKLWGEVLEATSHRTAAPKLWRLIRSLHSRQVGDPDTHEAILTPTRPSIPSPKGQANLLIDHYASISRLPHSPADRLVQRQLRRLPLDRGLPPQFTPAMVLGAIRPSSTSAARGPDGLAYADLKHLGPNGIGAIVSLFNQSIRLNSIPTLWKLSTIIPILKPGKSPTLPASYRPISLLCVLSKVLERLVLSKTEPFIRLSPSQHGFRSLHSTSTLLTSLCQSTLEGLNHGKPALRSLVCAIDISKAFDTVPRYVLISKILRSGIPTPYRKWLANFVSGRQGRISWRGVTSKTRMFPNGVPQGAVLSPSLFNLFLADLPSPQVASVSVFSYADDVTILSQHPQVDVAAEHLQNYIHLLEDWLSSNRMAVSAEKSSLTVITPHTREYSYSPHVTLHSRPIPVTPTPRSWA